MVIAGPDEGGHRAQIEQAIQRAGLTDRFEFTGPVYGKAKVRLYEEADLFVLPSFSENFGIVIAEALAAGVPAVTTNTTPWADLVVENCGWCVAPTVEALASALDQAFRMPRPVLLGMGERARAYAARKLDWDSVCRDMVAVYQWLLGKGGRPSCVSGPIQ
jgi:glycosyltransferase involved in cell wall biosynthesis